MATWISMLNYGIVVAGTAGLIAALIAEEAAM